MIAPESEATTPPGCATFGGEDGRRPPDPTVKFTRGGRGLYAGARRAQPPRVRRPSWAAPAPSSAVVVCGARSPERSPPPIASTFRHREAPPTPVPARRAQAEPGAFFAVWDDWLLFALTNWHRQPEDAFAIPSPDGGSGSDDGQDAGGGQFAADRGAHQHVAHSVGGQLADVPAPNGGHDGAMPPRKRPRDDAGALMEAPALND